MEYDHLHQRVLPLVNFSVHHTVELALFPAAILWIEELDRKLVSMLKVKLGAEEVTIVLSLG